MRDLSTVKGYAYLSYVTPLRKECEDLWLRIRDKLPSESRAFFDGEIFADQWYPRTHLHALMHAMELATNGDERAFRDLGSRAARYQLKTIYRVFFSFMTPAIVFRRATSIWKRQSSAGLFTVVEEGDNYLIGTLFDPSLPKHMPIVIAGWSETIIAMLGRTPYPVEITSPSPGHWVFRVHWVG